MATIETSYSEFFARRTRLSALNLLLIGLGICLYFFLGGFLNIPVWILVLPGIVGGVVAISMQRPSSMLAIMMLTVIIIQLRASNERTDTTMFAALAGAILTGAIFFVLLKRTVAPEHTLDSNAHKFFLIYFAWVALLGIFGMVFSNLPFEDWYREVLVMSPLLIIPFLFLYIDLDDRRDRRLIYGAMILVALISMAASVVNIRSSVLASTYLFELSYKSATIINAPFMTLLFFNLYITEERKKRQSYFLIGMVLAIIALLLTHNRTMWSLGPASILVTTLLLPRVQRKKAVWLLCRLAVGGVIVLAILYVIFPMARILIGFFLSYFLTSSNLRTDASLNARYIEWRYIWDAISESPIFGYGLAGTYRTFNWFGGHFYDTSYTHNGYLGVLQRGGIIGLILLFTGYFKFITKGVRLLHLNNLSALEIAFLRTGLGLLCLLLIGTNTLNIFSHRDILLHVGLVWGYFLYISRKKDPSELREGRRG